MQFFDVANEFYRWDDDVVFKNQARGTEDKRKKEFINVRRFSQLGRVQFSSTELIIPLGSAAF